jgi:hypothetical protein
MSASAIVTRHISIPGMALTDANSISAASSKRLTVRLPRGFLATLTTRTNDHAGVCVLEDGHDITISSVVDLYSSAGACLVKNCTVSAVAGDLVTFAGTAVGSGMPNTPGLAFTCSAQVSSDLAIPDTSVIHAVGYSANSVGALPDAASGAAACVTFRDVGNSLALTVQVAFQPVGFDNVSNIDAGDSSTVIDDIASTTIVVASNPLRTQKSIFQFGCLLA